MCCTDGVARCCAGLVFLGITIIHARKGLYRETIILSTAPTLDNLRTFSPSTHAQNVAWSRGVIILGGDTPLPGVPIQHVYMYHYAKWACAHLKPLLPVSLLLCAVASRHLSQNPPIPLLLSIIVSSWSSKPFLLASGLPEATTLPIAGHLPLITTSYSARPSLIIQTIPFAVGGMRMCACMCELGHRALAPEHAILTLDYLVEL